MNLQNHNLTKMQTKRQRTHNPISKLYTNLIILNGKKDIKQQNKTSRTPKEKTEGKWQPNGTNASRKQCHCS